MLPADLTERRWGAKRRWGYGVWAVAGFVIGAPEIIAAKDDDWVPFMTISKTVGHLERYHTWVGLIVIAVVVFLVFSTVKLRPPTRSDEVPVDEDAQLQRTLGGRLTKRAPGAAPSPSPAAFDDEGAPVVFAICAAVVLGAVAAATWIAAEHWSGDDDYQASYILYGSLGFSWLVVPSLVAFFDQEVPFATLARSIANLQDWLRSRQRLGRFGPMLAWLVAYVILAGLVILLLHLVFSPYPDITEIINPTG